MQRDFNLVFKTFAGQPIAQDGEPITLKRVAVNALMSTFEDEANLSGEEKFKRYKLASRINDAAMVDVSAEEVTLLKRLIGKLYTPIIVGPAFEALEAESTAN